MCNLYDRIKTACESKGITVSALCLQLGMSKSVLSDLKSGRKKTLSADTLGRIAAYLQVSTDSLLGSETAPSDILDQVDVAFYGDFKEHYHESDKLYVYERNYEGKKLLVICSFSDKIERFKAPKGFDLAKGKVVLGNYDCINSCWLESQGGYRYKESYFGDMIDTLHLNPAKVKKALTEKGYTVYGRFPNKKYRDGKEQVSYEDFCQELENSCCGANLLTYIGLVNLRDLYDADFKIKEVIIPKGNTCGLFSSMYGGGSLIEMELKSDVRIRLDKARKDGYGFRLRLDNERSEYDCSIKHVYGVCDSFFGKQVSIVPAN